jgi:integrase
MTSELPESAANRQISTTSVIMKYAIRLGLCDTNPCREVERYRTKKRNRYICDDELCEFISLLDDRFKVLVRLAYITGLRRSDLFGLTWSSIRPEGLYISTQKTDTNLVIEMTDDLADTLAIARRLETNNGDPEQRIFHTRTGTPYSISGFYSYWSRKMDQFTSTFRRERFKFHDIRRKAGTDAERTQGREYARQLLGHTSQAMTARYVVQQTKIKPLKNLKWEK